MPLQDRDTRPSPTGDAPTPAHGRPLVLVTAGGTRLGAEISRALAASGWSVAIHHRGGGAQARELARTLCAQGTPAQAFAADLGDPRQVQSLFREVLSAMGEVTALINNAAEFSEPSGGDFFDWAHLERVMGVNLAAPLALIQLLFEHCRARAGQGAVVNLLDQKLWNLNPDHLAYTLSKSALHTATAMLAQRCAPTLRVNAVAPGLTLPAENQAAPDFERVSRHRLTSQASTPADITRAVRFLLDTPAATGSVLMVDAGQHLVPMQRDFSYL